ncbi:MAG: hypothetical protein ACKKMV_03085 [Candidatus Nealsonbacteria bacterium]
MKIIINIRKKIEALFDFLHYDYRLTVWRFIKRYRSFKEWFRKNSEIIKRGLILIVCFLVAHTVIRFINPSSLSSDIANYFISIGAMTGGVIAIVFTLSIFSKQNAADLYSSQYFEVYTHDWIERFTYSVAVFITILFFGLGILFSHSQVYLTHTIQSILIYASVFGIGLIFVLVDWQYENVRKKANPLVALTFLEGKMNNYLNNLHKDAKRIAKIVKSKHKDASDELILASTYYNYLQPHLLSLHRPIENLFEITLRLSERKEVKAVNRAISVIHNILCRYLELRKDSSFIIPSAVFFAFESDSSNFIRTILEDLNNIGEVFIKEYRTENAVFLVDVYKSLAIHSKNIKFIGRANENPIFEQIKGYFSLYVGFAIRKKEQEILFQASKVFGDLALIAIEKNLNAPLLGIQGDLYKVALFGITEKKSFIVDECYNSWLKILNGVFQYKFFIARHQISEALENIEKITTLMYASISSGYLPDNFITRMSLGKPYDGLIILVPNIVNRYFNSKNEEDKRFYRSNLIILFEEINRNLRRLSEKIKNCDSTLINSVGRLIFQLNYSIVALLKEKNFNNHPEELTKELAWNIYLPTWFVRYSKSFRASFAFQVLTDSIAKTGLILFERDDSDDLIMDCIKALSSITKQTLEKIKNGYGFSEPRLMLKVCYLGILGLKHNKQNILTEAGIRIYEFEELYEKKYLSDLNLPKGVDPDKVSGLPRKDQLFLEIFSWRDDFIREKRNRHRLMDDAKEMMFDLIDEIDIDRFMFEVWGSFPAGSPVEQEIEKQFRKKEKAKKMRILITVLQNISIQKRSLNSE